MSVVKFFKKKKSPENLVASTVRKIDLLEDEDSKADPPKSQKAAATAAAALNKVSMNLAQMKFTFYGDSENEPQPAQQDKLAEELFQSELLLQFLEYMPKLEFEARKDVAGVYKYVLRHKKAKATAYVQARPQIIDLLVKGYDDPEIALNCGAILRPVVRLPELNTMLLTNEALFSRFFDYVQLPTFDVASDAFATFRLMLTKHKDKCAEFLKENFDDVFDKFNKLLQSKNYVTKRQSLKLLGELLLSRKNYAVMMRYINCPENLKIMMRLLRGNTKAIQIEAFHVFKIFVANPKKSEGVVQILVKNKEKLIAFLVKFHNEKDDEQFNEEKSILLNTLGQLDDSMLKAEEPAPTAQAQ